MERNCSSGLETELRLGIPGVICVKTEKNEKKRDFSYVLGDAGGGGEAEKKNQVVGWPPVRAYRRKNSFNDQKKMYVKVSVDGAPFLRKIDLSMHKGYNDLVMALEQLFGCQGIGEAFNDSDNGEYVPTYEDKDGDLMMLGDVPWEMFIESCKRLRIMKKSDTNNIDGLQAKDLLRDFPIMNDSKDGF